MSEFKNARDFEGLYDELGVGWDLGCLMLDTDSPYHSMPVAEGEEYVSTNPRNKYVRGVASSWHVTVRYGLLDPVRKVHVDRVLEGFQMPKVLRLGTAEAFQANDDGQPFEYVVVHVEDDRLRDLNTQLSVLPNVNTFAEYMPHITLGYFRPGWFEANRFNIRLKSQVKVLGLNYGDHLLAP